MKNPKWIELTGRDPQADGPTLLAVDKIIFVSKKPGGALIAYEGGQIVMTGEGCYEEIAKLIGERT